MEIRICTPERAAEIAQVFHKSVHAIEPSLYSNAQKDAWAPAPPNLELWAKRLRETTPFVALIERRAVGFMGLRASGYIDYAYTHPDFQGRGVASALLHRVVEEASTRRISRLYLDASLDARGFFGKRGFSLIRKNTVHRNGVALSNFTMARHLPGSVP